MAKNKSQYDSTLNLPKTLFEMRAGLPKKEPVMLKDWDDNDLYNQLMKHNQKILSWKITRRNSSTTKPGEDGKIRDTIPWYIPMPSLRE